MAREGPDMVTGATEGIVYIRAEYPLAVHRLNRAMEQARQ
jgi:NADH-quinone oxidoreductase subunit F